MSLPEKLAAERRARLAAERLLELKQAELFEANRKLGLRARALSEEIFETRAEVANVRDENVRVKTDLTHAQQQIEIAEKRLWHSVQTINDGFAVFDINSTLVMANAAYLSVFEGFDAVRPGISYQEILKLITEEGIAKTGALSPADWRAKMWARWNSPEPEPLVIELWDGGFIRMLDKRGHAGDMVSLCLNITRSVLHERKLKEVGERAEAASRAKSAFLANMSHEIRTPMNGVVGMAELLTETPLNDEQRLYADTIRNSGQALLAIINDVLDYSKIEAEKLVLHPEPFDLEQAVHEIMTLMQPAAIEKGISLLVDYDLFLPTRFIGDPGRMRQIFTNLIGNAVKFTPKGHVLVRITGVVDDKTQSCGIHAGVEDTGIGIDPEMTKSIFGEFNQVDDERSRQFEGTGLGLAITQRLIWLMNGDIWVQSELGHGSCFGLSLKLPLAPDPAAPLPVIPEWLKQALIVDKVIPNRVILSKKLEHLGVKTTICESTEEALDALKGEIDVVFANHRQPILDALTLASEIRDAGHRQPILLLSANPTPLAKDPKRSLIQGVLQKPVPRHTLFKALSTLIQFEASPANTEAKPTHPVDKTKPAESASLVQRRIRVMAAEDNKTNQLVFRKMVQTLDVDLFMANNGQEAVDNFLNFRPDIIFMDISMPQMDGKEATREIRRLEEGTQRRVPIVALTAHALEGDEHSILEAGLDYYLTKPLSKEAISAQILNLCDQQSGIGSPKDCGSKG